jgi:hypothetical protein
MLPAVAMGVDIGPSPELMIAEKVSFMNHSADDGMADTEPTDDSDDIDFIDNALDQYNVDFATLCANVAK